MQTIPAQRTQVQIQVNTFIRSVYNWMAIPKSTAYNLTCAISGSTATLSRKISARVAHPFYSHTDKRIHTTP